MKVGSNAANAPTASFSITTLYFPSAATIAYGNSTIEVPSNSLKFTVEIGNWPFLDTANSLQFGVTVDFKSQDGDEEVSEATSTARNEQTVTSGDLQITSPLMAILDDTETTIDANLAESNNGKSFEMTWKFPHFEQTLVYDPVTSDNNPESSGVSSRLCVNHSNNLTMFFLQAATTPLSLWLAALAFTALVTLS